MRQIEKPAGRAPDAPPKTWLVGLGGFGVLLAIVALGLGPAVYRKVEHKGDDETPANLLPRLTPASGAFHPHAPAFADADGRPAVIVLAGDEKTGEVRVVALERKSLDVRWRSVVFAGNIDQLVVSGSHVVVTDARSKVRVFSLANGRVEHVVEAGGRVVHACPHAEGVLLTTTHSELAPSLLDTKTGVVREGPAGATCGFLSYDAKQCPSERACTLQPDRSNDPRPPREFGARAPTTRSGGPSARVEFWSVEVLAERDRRISRGRVDGDDGRAIGVAWDAVTRAIAWQAPLGEDGDRELSAGIAALDATRVVFLYPSTTKHGAYRLVARSAETGARSFAAIVPESAGAKTTALSLEGDDAFVVADHALHVFDLRSGALRKTITKL